MKIVQQIRGTEVVEDARILPPGVITVDTDSWVARIHDGVTPGGHKMARDDDLTTSHAREFTAAATFGVPGNVTLVNQFCNFTVAGDYNMDTLASITLVGGGFWVQADVAAVILKRRGADVISDNGVDVTQLALVQGEIVRIVKKSAARYVVLSRY